MRTISKAVLSAGLAAATVVSGLSFGAAAATASGPDATATGAGRLVGPLVTESGTTWDNPFSAPSVVASGQPIAANRSATLAAALAAATDWTIPGATGAGPISPASDPSLCVTAGTIDTPATLQRCASGAANQQFVQAPNTGSNNPIGIGLRSTSNNGFLGLSNGETTMYLQSQSTADRLPALDRFVAAFDGVVSESSVPGRSATITGTASPNASIIYRVNGGPERDPKADKDGKWSVNLTGLKLGVNTVHFEQWEPDTDNGGNKKTGEFDLDVDLKVAPVTAKYAFDTQQNMPVQVSGTAEPLALVEIKNAAGDVVASARANDVTGNWQTTVPAPNAGGTYGVRVDQKIDGETVAGPGLNINYGAGVVITTPGNDWVHDGGTLPMTGTGEPGGTVQVRADGKQGVIGETTVLASGRWNLTTSDLNAKKHDLVVTQSAKGNNTTTAKVTLNPDADKQDISVTSPKNGDQYDANSVLRFTGEGTPGAQIELDPNNGLAKYYTDVKPDGTWTIDRPMGTGPYTFSAIQKVNGTEQSRVDGITVTAKNTAPIIKDFALTSPEKNSFHQGQTVTFTGEGAAGDLVRLHVTNFASTDVTTTVKNDGTWSVSKYLGTGAYTFDITQERAGTTTGAIRDFELNQTADKPFVVTSPKTGSSFPANTNVTFTGTGQVGASIQVKPTNGLAPVNTVVRADGRWSVSKFLGNGPYTFAVTMTPKSGSAQTSAPITLTPAS